MKKPRICAVVLNENLTDFLVQLEKAQQNADMVELRIDYIKNLSKEILTLIKDKTHKSAIVCCRSVRHGGKFQGSVDEQQAILQESNDLRFDYIDIDLAVAKNIKIKNKFSKVILSYHDFEKTPSLKELTQRAVEMRVYKPDVLKFAVSVHNDKDVEVVLTFLLDKKPDEKMIVIGMNEVGKITRLLSPLLGGYLTFASVNDLPSASGQMDIRTLEEWYKKIEEPFVATCVERLRSKQTLSWEMLVHQCVTSTSNKSAPESCSIKIIT